MSPTIKRYWIPPGSFPAPPHEAQDDGQLSVRSYSRGKWSPDADIYEVDDGLVIIVDIAGVNKKEIAIVVEQKILSIAGVRREAAIPRKKAVFRLEIDYGHFEKRFRIPDEIDAENIEARYEDGFLFLRLPRFARRKIEIKRE